MADYRNYTPSASDFSKNVTDNGTVSNMFVNTKDFKDVTSYKLMRGVPDFGSLVQFNPYETGYAAFIICQMPKFIELLARRNSDYNKLIKNWAHIIEYEFKSFDGLNDMEADTIQLGDELNQIDVINKVNLQGGSEFTLSYEEKSGSPLTKFARLYLSGIKDPRTQVKTYHGLIHNGDLEPGFENEVFTFLFIATDNTMRKVEYATLIVGAQLKSADISMYNYTKGDIGKHDVNVRFNGYPIVGTKIDAAAQDMITYLLSADAKARRIVVNSDDFDYTGIESIAKTLKNYGASEDQYATVGAIDSEAGYSVDDFYSSSYDGLVVN